MKNKDEVINVEKEAISGCLLGTAIGDALGLPYEGLKPKRATRLLGKPWRYRLLFGRGMVSDDTEHSCLVLQSLIESQGEPDRFAQCLAKRMRKWFLLIPAGVGKATTRSCVKLLIGFKPEKSGVFSAGNGPAMRSAILGAAINDLEQLARLVRVSSRLTHTDPKAEQGHWLSRLPHGHHGEPNHQKSAVTPPAHDFPDSHFAFDIADARGRLLHELKSPVY